MGRSAGSDTIDVIDPATEEAYPAVVAGSATDVDRAVAAARAAFAPSCRSSYQDEEEAVVMANDTICGLAAYE